MTNTDNTDTFSVDSAIFSGFSAGDYARAYISDDLETAISSGLVVQSDAPAWRAAFVLGFFSTYECSEIPASDHAALMDAYDSHAGARCRELGYCGERDLSELWQ